MIPLKFLKEKYDSLDEEIIDLEYSSYFFQNNPGR
jgi:hypothetical protein